MMPYHPYKRHYTEQNTLYLLGMPLRLEHYFHHHQKKPYLVLSILLMYLHLLTNLLMEFSLVYVLPDAKPHTSDHHLLAKIYYLQKKYLFRLLDSNVNDPLQDEHQVKPYTIL